MKNLCYLLIAQGGSIVAWWDPRSDVHWCRMVSIFPSHLWACDRNWRNHIAWY